MPSENLTTVLGVLETVKDIKLTNVFVCVISYIAMGFKGTKQGNGLYACLLDEGTKFVIFVYCF